MKTCWSAFGIRLAHWRACVLGLIIAQVCWAGLALAAEDCQVQIDPKTGAIEVSARRVGANPRWSIAPDGTKLAFADEANCFDAEKGELEKCHLGTPGTLAAITPPPACSLCVSDNGLGSCCVSHIKGCTPGVRTGDASLNTYDPRLSLPFGRIFYTNCAFSGCLDTPTQYICPDGKALRFIQFPELDDEGDEQATGCSGNPGNDDVRFYCCDIGF